MKNHIFTLLTLFVSVAFARDDEGPIHRLRRRLQVKKGSLGLCQSDCNTDADCQPGLICWERKIGEPAPGCTLSTQQRNSPFDFCVAASSRLTKATYVGNNGVSNLGLCQGDCDQDDDCAEGLRCHQRSRGDSVPGCDLDSNLFSSDYDFCVKDDATPPTNKDTFALKLYWEPGYLWQEETIERKWCLNCRENCHIKDEIVIYDCADSPTQWEFVSHGPNEVQIKVANRGVCIQKNSGRDLELERCDRQNPLQRFSAVDGTFNDSRFEIQPKQRQGWCMTQRHHPKTDEFVNVEPCTTARRSTTSYWNKV